MQPITNELRRWWQASRPLMIVGYAMLAVFALSLVGLALDPREIGGAPAWLKPAKFAISTSIYAFTFAWIFTYLAAWPRLTRIVGWTTAVVVALEVALIDLQAARGTTSHFNIGTPLDAVIFGTMGFAILVAWAVSIALTVALFRQRFADRAFGWALRIGLLISVLGSATGGLMTRPTAGQLASARATHSIPIVGSHTVGAADGGPGLPGTGWSREHGDLRVPHFIGLHAVQLLPLLTMLLGRGASAVARRRIAFMVAASYASLFVILLAQALGGQPLLAPEGATLAALLLWLTATLAAAVLVVSSRAKGARLQSNTLVVLP